VRKGQARLIRIPNLDRTKPIHEQLRRHMRELILTGGIAPGARLPAQRQLARDLGLSRNTITDVFETLTSEGLLESRIGAGTFVVNHPLGGARRLTAPADPLPEAPLHQGVADFSLFPLRDWRRLQGRRWRDLPTRALGFGDPAGWSGLRFLLAQRIAATRGVTYNAEQIQIFSTARAALQACCLALGARGRQVWMESPGYSRAAAGFAMAGTRVEPVGVDGEGLKVSEGISTAPEAVLAYTTPSSQFPTGAVLSPARRRELLNWAREKNSWIIEDDYEIDFVFEGNAPPALASGGEDGRVIYLSGLNTLLFPSAQLACLAVPDALVDRFNAVRAVVDGAINVPTQMVTYDFIEGGYLAAHIRRCREAYHERRLALRSALSRRLQGLINVVQQPVGLHVTAWLPDGVSASDVRLASLAEGLVVHDFAGGRGPLSQGLFMGFAGFSPSTIERSVQLLEKVLTKRRFSCTS
jgi:GntR family transcriptional regulator / MocR family aminotransferase